MKKLHLAYMGYTGKIRFVEDHEILFITGDKKEDIIPQLKEKSQFGLGVHIDFLLKISSIDGYKIDILSEERSDENLKLFFGYMGAESKDRYMEDHELVFVISSNIVEAKKKLKEKSTLGNDLHVDFMKELKEINGNYISLSEIPDGEDSIEKVIGYSLI